METTAPVSVDLEAVTDLVMNRQLIDIQRDHAKGIVKMVLECAAEATGPSEPPYKPNVRRINVTVEEASTLGVDRSFSDHVLYSAGATTPCTVTPPTAIHAMILHQRP